MKTLSLKSIFLILFILTCILILPVGVLSAEKQVVGWIENVIVFPGNFEIKAKLDTGAKNSSMHAVHIDEFKRNGHDWVRFEVVNRQGHTETFETKVIRTAEIKRKNSESQKRLVIRLGVCLGTFYKEAEVNLVNRGNFNYKMLIGRSFLKESFIVDSEQTFTVKTKCQRTQN
ncbi:MAG: ATP-dependent zinc protease [Desulfobacterales bacterium]|uniref:ATP-dependent zinc protease n=1 Tax=Candidatus Desulfatibia vada TaxID=2841696 RepID=A0A8J6NS35_9BACT|nr:ATP-dependent zinc protease [Candidatus Desulfatibia vada]MBL6971221.1 ATP-dependent zinc protease [Desulfobacterales bacterium]